MYNGAVFEVKTEIPVRKEIPEGVPPMKSVKLVVLALVAISLLVVLPAWSQGGNPPASTKESGATSGHGMTPGEQSGKSSAANVEEEIKKLETERAAAVVKADIATLEAQTADDYSLINANGQVMDKKETMNAIKTGQVKITSDELSDLKVRVYGHVAVITGKADVKGTLSGTEVNGPVMFTRVYVKKNGRWQSVAFQQTRVSKP
jgi:ketosteroid isomerase-like protein